MTHTIQTPVLVVGGGPTSLVLVRPDLHIAWRGTTVDDPAAIIACVRGAH